MAVPAADVYCQPLAGIGMRGSVTCWRTVRVARDLSTVAAAYARVLVIVVALSNTMYSYEGPVIVDPPAFFAIGTVIVRRSPPAVAEMSHPLHAMEYPWFIRNPSPASAAVVGLLPPPDRLRSPNSLFPRLLTSKKSLWLPRCRSTGFRMKMSIEYSTLPPALRGARSMSVISALRG